MAILVHVATGDCGLAPIPRGGADAVNEAFARAMARITYESGRARDGLEVVSVAPFFLPDANGPGTVYVTVVARYVRD